MTAPIGFMVDRFGNPDLSIGVSVDPATGAPSMVTSVAGAPAVVTPVGGGPGGAGTLAGAPDLGTFDFASANPSTAAVKATANAAATSAALAAEAAIARAAESAAQATANAAIPATQKGAANGVASLDGGGHVPLAQIPASLLGGLNYQTTYNAATNTPALVAGNKGFYWKVATAGTSLGFTWVVGDLVIDNGTTLDKVDGNPNEVTQVAGRTGNVVLTSADVSGLAASATTDTTNAANIGSGTLPTARLPVPNAGVPTAQATAHVFADIDNCENVVATGTPGYVLNTGRVNGWGLAIKGAFTLTGTATVTDLRTTTGTAWCCLVQTDTTGAGLTYDMVGTK